MPTMTGAQFLAETLHGYGVSHYFFMPVSVPEAMPEFDRVGITPVMAHTEKGAAYMADGYARLSGKIGVCGAQSVGALNLAAGLQDARLGCSPVLALTGRLSNLSQHRHAYQELDHMGPFGAVTKYSVPVTCVDELPVFLRQALREATSGTPGPTHLDLYGIAGGDVMTGTADLDIVIENDFRHIPATRPAAAPESVQAVMTQIQAALRPVIVAGGGVRCSGARTELVELAEKLQVPVITSLNAKEMFPPDHELALGISGQYSRFCANKALAEADLVFFIGSHAGGQITNDWRLPRPGTRVLQLDINPAELGRSFPLTAGMQCDARTGLRQLLETAESPSPQNSEARVLWLHRTQELVQEWHQSVSALSASNDIPLRPERLCADLTRLLPNDAVLVSDTGHSGVWTGTMIDLRSPEHSYIRCAGSLGWGLPAAIGAKCAAPERPVLCFTGDGGMWYHLTELDTAVRYGLHTITLVNNNASLNQEQAMNERIYGARTANSDRMWMLTDADFSTIASTMGGLGICVRRPDELEDALQEALAADRPVVIDVKTHIEGIAPRAWD
ncbi:MAG: acetolactate synthase [Chloroflexi bacterium]|nr:acetolactate synthase [Chloroflexota bacterium]HCU74062.1 acetolactate synthase [Chloroflexota bacterium]|tara:strand:- start:1070 stop:2752 length:1683 start_codon:yes stop_codon:yes gene_type:complete